MAPYHTPVTPADPLSVGWITQVTSLLSIVEQSVSPSGLVRTPLGRGPKVVSGFLQIFLSILGMDRKFRPALERECAPQALWSVEPP